MSNIIAQRNLIAVSGDGENTAVTIEISAPVENDGHFTCSVNFIGLLNRVFHLHGDDSMQALCLAIRHATTMLEIFVSEGGEFLYPDDKSKVDSSFLLG